MWTDWSWWLPLPVRNPDNCFWIAFLVIGEADDLEPRPGHEQDRPGGGGGGAR